MGYIKDQMSNWYHQFPGPYTTIAKVNVHDTRLRYCQLIALIVIAGLVILELLLLHKDALFEVPIGNVNSWSRFKDLDPIPPGTPIPSYCNNPAYDWVPTGSDLVFAGGLTSSNSDCPLTSVGSMLRLTDSGINVHTWTSRAFINFTCEDGSPGLCAPREEPRTSSFFRRVDEIPLNFIHGYSTSFGLTGSNPHSRIFDQTGHIAFEFPDGQPVSGITVADVLRVAGANLDSRNSQGYLKNVSDPFFRMTGVVILVKISYSNKRSWDVNEEVRADIHAEIVNSAWGYAGSVMSWIDYPKLQLREDFTAVQIRFTIEGTLGRFDYFTLILQIMAAAFLLNVAQWCVDFVGMYFIGDREAFAAAKYHTLELNRQRSGRKHDDVTRAATIAKQQELIRKHTGTQLPTEKDIIASSTNSDAPQLVNGVTPFRQSSASPINIQDEGLESGSTQFSKPITIHTGASPHGNQVADEGTVLRLASVPRQAFDIESDGGAASASPVRTAASQDNGTAQLSPRGLIAPARLQSTTNSATTATAGDATDSAALPGALPRGNSMQGPAVLPSSSSTEPVTITQEPTTLAQVQFGETATPERPDADSHLDGPVYL